MMKSIKGTLTDLVNELNELSETPDNDRKQRAILSAIIQSCFTYREFLTMCEKLEKAKNN